MPLNASSLQVGAAAIAADIDHATLHTAQPDNTGSNLTTAGALAVAATAAGGVVSIGSDAFTGGAPNGPCTYMGFWHGTPGAGGVFRGYVPLSGDSTFNSSGQYTEDTVTLTGSAS